MVVADTNIIAALFIRTAHSDKSLALRTRDAVWRTDPFALVEFSNVLATYERASYLTKAEAVERLRLAEEFLKPNFYNVPHATALEFAMRHKVTAYDARFLAVAQHFHNKLTTEDRLLRDGE